MDSMKDLLDKYEEYTYGSAVARASYLPGPKEDAAVAKATRAEIDKRIAELEDMCEVHEEHKKQKDERIASRDNRIAKLEAAISDIGTDIHMAKTVDIAWLDLAEEKIEKLGLSEELSARRTNQPKEAE